MEKFVLDFIQNPEQYYLNDNERININNIPELNIDDVVFFRVDEITFEEKSPRKEALENVLSALRVKGTNFIYLIVGNGSGVSFYYGLSRDLIQKVPIEVSIEDLGEQVLKESLQGNFRGSKLSKLSQQETENLMEYVSSMELQDYLHGVPGINEDNEKYQGIDRLVDTMLNDEFAFLIVAKYLPQYCVKEIERNIYHFYDELVPFSKKNIQDSTNSSRTDVDTESHGQNTTDSTSTVTGTTNNFGKAIQEQRSVATKIDDDETRTQSTSKTTNDGTGSTTESTTKTGGKNITYNHTTGFNSTEGNNKSTSREFVNKEAQEWLNYIDDVLLKRLDYGRGKGLYIATFAIATKNPLVKIKLENTITALFASERGNRVPLSKFDVAPNIDRLTAIKNLQLPIADFVQPIGNGEILTRAVLSQYASPKRIYLGNWFSVGELSVVAGLPQKEIVGLSLREEVEFGLNIKNEIHSNKIIVLGNLIQGGHEIVGIQIPLNKDELDKHIFVTGVTGSGKTTTCQKILIESGFPFCVIEPAKTEYRVLASYYDDLLIFTLGKDKLAPFRLNPLEFFPHESITAHVDMIKASIESAFDMEAAIPQIIEKALYACYEDCGWNVYDDTNVIYDDPFADGVYSFPTLSELVSKTVEIVEKQGFDERLKNDYIGSIRARLQGLLVGSKGMMLNTYRSLNFRDLIHKKIILEMEDIKSGAEKSLIIGFILAALVEAIKAEFFSNPGFKHITLLEEAHRLLSKYQPGESMSKKQGIEMFANMLAEIRKYGESLIIVDQIPGKLTPDVLKNTNTKIVHKIFAQDDKEAIGNSMALTDDQKSFLSFLDCGRAIVFSQGWDKGIQVHVLPATDTSSQDRISDSDIKDRVMEYYYSCWERGVWPGSCCSRQKPSINDFKNNFFCVSLYKKFDVAFNNSLENQKMTDEFVSVYNDIKRLIEFDGVIKYLLRRFYVGENSKREGMIRCLLEHVEKGILCFEEIDANLDILSTKRRK